MSVNEATLRCYLDQWSEYFEGAEFAEDLLTRLRKFAFDGRMRSCHFRSVCWRIFLSCLPCETSKWKETLAKSRQCYVKIKNKHVTKPSHEANGSDLNVENPLSQNDQSSWKKFFKNSELKKTIERDVTRTFPEMEYFHDEKVHKLLVDVLFCYAQEHSDLSYRQGMHELLAPLVFIIHCDLQAACHAREIGSLTKIIDLALDEEYLEHDAYDMFCHLMESTNPWYSVTERCKKEEAEEEEGVIESENSVKTENNSIQTVPFQPQEIATSGGPTLAITNKLNHIHNTLLVQHDLQLHTHLNRLEIIPQVFGLRWIRLLFGREFSLQDLLVLWDAMFADSSTLDLVDYLFVAMLINIRQILLNADYSTCMQILMKYPPVDDINDIVQAAKDIRVLKGRSFSDSFKENVIPSASGNKISKSEKSPKTPATPQGNVTKQNTFTKIFKDFTRKVIPENRPAPPVPSHLKDPTYAGHIRSPSQMKSANPPRWGTNGSPVYFKQSRSLTEARAEQMQPKYPAKLEEEVVLLHQEMEKMQQMCLFCSDKIDACVTVLQSSVSASMDSEQSAALALNKTSDPSSTANDSTVSEQEKFEKEQILVTVASLKQVRDILKGTLTFNPNLREYRSKRVEKQENQNGTDTVVEAPQSLVNDNTVLGDT